MYIQKLNIPIGGEDILEIKCSIDECGHHIAHYARVFRMQNGRAGQNVEKKMNVAGVGKIAGHRFKHAGDQTHPHELVQHIQTEQLFAQLAALIQIQIRLERFAREKWQLHQLLVQEHHALHHHVHILQNRPSQMHFADFDEFLHQLLVLQRTERLARLHLNQTQLRILRPLEEVQVPHIPIGIQDFICRKIWKNVVLISQPNITHQECTYEFYNQSGNVDHGISHRC